MVDPFKCSTEVDLNGPGLLPPLQSTLVECETLTNVHPSAETSRVGELGVLEHTSSFHKLSKTNRNQTLEHLAKHRCDGNWFVIGC